MPQSVRESIPISNEPPTLPLKLDTIKSTAVPQRKGSADSTGSYPGLAAYSGGGFGAASPPTEILRTPDERVEGGRGRSLRVTELYDDYYKSAGAYDDDIPELPPIGGKKIEAWAKKTAAAGPPSSFPPSYTSSPPESSGKGGLGLTRGPSNASRRGFGLARSESRVGTNAESRYDDDGSDAGSFYDMVKIRVKVGVVVSVHRVRRFFLASPRRPVAGRHAQVTEHCVLRDSVISPQATGLDHDLTTDDMPASPL
jgi:hypothetical protein